MKPYENHESVAALMDRSNVDTDQIIPKQFLKKLNVQVLVCTFFHDWRYLADGSDNPEFELNKPAFKGAKILVAGDNFGCGSSREHAPWAIADFGINTIISTSYADIFYSNSFKNGILLIKVTKDVLDGLMDEIRNDEGMKISVDLEKQEITTANGTVVAFEIDAFRKENLLKGLDDIGLTLNNVDHIAAFEAQQKQSLPWLWN